jgi:NitT/TauT family transport system substrate-binding protein
MNQPRIRGLSRRDFLTAASALGGSALFGLSSDAAAEPPPETTRIRLVKIPAICLAPQYLAEELLRLEGFTEVEYVELDRTGGDELLAAGGADVSVTTPPSLIPLIDAGKGLVALAGIHGGCYELFSNARIHGIRDLKGKRVVVSAIPSVEYYYMSSILAYVGMDPRKDVNWIVAETFGDTMQQFVDGKVDAFLGFPPQPQKLRLKKIGHVIVNTAQDRPWQQYYCCMVAANLGFASRYPVATKRAVRAILKATDRCARDPEGAARAIVAKGYEPSYEIALDVLKSLSYDRWRTYDIEDSLRFYALRFYEVGMIKSTPQKIIAQGLDLRFVNELKRELKA